MTNGRFVVAGLEPTAPPKFTARSARLGRRFTGPGKTTCECIPSRKGRRLATPRVVSALVALLLSVSLVALIELVATSAGAVWLVVVTTVLCLSGTWLGWDATKPPR